MNKTNRYTALICSLPPCTVLFDAGNTPISRFQLKLRLRELDPVDANDIAILGEILDWFTQPQERTDEAFLALLEARLEQLNNPDVRAFLAWRMEFRTVVAALRRRHDGAPPPEGKWGYGRWTEVISKHWQEPDLGLRGVFPWVGSVSQLMQEEKALAVEKILLCQVWLWLDRVAWQHSFDFPAVAIYRMRWDLIYRWIRYEKNAAQKRFDSLVENILDTPELRNLHAKFLI